MQKLSYDEAKEIADLLTKTENPDEDYAVTENALAEKWSIDVETFHEIASGIFQMLDFSVSLMTETPYVGISKGNEWIAKKEVNKQFIRGMIYWLTQGEEVDPGKGFMREITLNGEVEFIISIKKPKTNEPKN